MKGKKIVNTRLFNFDLIDLQSHASFQKRYPDRKKNVGTAAVQIP